MKTEEDKRETFKTEQKKTKQDRTKEDTFNMTEDNKRGQEDQR